MGLSINATMGERIRYYRKQADLTQKELAELCEMSESAIRNYELGNRIPDWETLSLIAGQLRVNYYALADTDIRALDGAAHALFKMEAIYGLYPKEVDGHIHFVFRESVPLSAPNDNLDFILRDSGTMFQYRLRSYVEAAALHGSGAWTDAEYELWKSKAPSYLEDIRKTIESHRSQEDEVLSHDATGLPGEKPQTHKHRRKRKINNGH